MKKVIKVGNILPILILGVLLMIPITAKASMKSLSMTMKQNNKSITCSCAVATVKGGALIGGSGINYNISYKKSSIAQYITLKSGSCKSNTSFSKYVFSSPTGYSVTLRLKESQKDKSDRGIGWGRIDY